MYILENTVLIFTSDNGAPRTCKEASNGPLSRYKGTVMEGGIRVHGETSALVNEE